MKIIDNIKTSYESNKRLFIVILTLILGIGLALAYYIPHIASGATGNVGITSNTIDELKFEIEPSSKVLLEVGQHNVLPDGTSPKSNITAKAILKANNKTKEVTKKYNLYLKINNNTFTYTTDKHTPEILMKIKKNGVVVNNIPGFNLKTITTADAVEEQSGFDITTSIGKLIIGEDIVIHDDFTNQDPTTDKWEFEFVFVNLKSNQSKNTGKMLDAEVLIQTDKISYSAGSIAAEVGRKSNNDMTVNIIKTVQGEHPISKYVYQLNDENPVTKNVSDINATSHTFDGLLPDTLYNITVKGLDSLNKETNIVKLSKKTDKLPPKKASDVIIAAFNAQDGGNTPTANMATSGAIYHHLNLDNSAEDDSYRYAGKKPNNYACIGSYERPCPVDNLYRIIGAFKNDANEYQLKVIRNTSIGNKAWNSETNKNTVDNKYNYWQWTEPDGTVKKADLNRFLNDTDKDNTDGFYKNISEIIKMVIDKDAKWYIDGHNSASITPKTMHDKEIKGNPIIAPIGLMYAHDYGYAANSNNWTTALNSYDKTAKNENWLYLGASEWLITRYFSGSNGAFLVGSSGCVYCHYDVSYGLGVRPVYYLLSNTKISDGDGTQESPYQI